MIFTWLHQLFTPMDDAHIHLLFNHFPITGIMIGGLALLIGLIVKSEGAKKTALLILVICSILAIPAFLSGEGAEEIVEEMGISHDIIHEHEEVAETYIWLVVGMGIIAAATFFLTYKKNPLATIFCYLTIALAFGCMGLGAQVGTTGGHINHPELRDDFSLSEGQKHED